MIIASNRGPVSYELTDDGAPEARRGGGGLASGLAPLLERGDTRWISAAMTDGDRVAARTGTAADDGVVLLDLDRDLYDDAYDRVSNETLWFCHHHLGDSSREPAFDRRWHQAWASFRTYNRRFAEAIVGAAADDAVVLVQDYHLSLVGSMVRELRPDLRTVHFHHTPFGEPAFVEMLPAEVRAELAAGLAGFSALGFHTERWVRDARASLARCGVAQPPHTFVAPLGVDVAALGATRSSAEVAAARERLLDRVGDRAFVVRVDRMELSKNIVRGFRAFDELLEDRPDLRGRVVFGAFCYPSRQGVEAYRRYAADVVATAEAVNDRWSTADWQPVLLETDDDYPRSVAAMALADVLVVNPTRDGLNLVAKEATVLSERAGALVLSSGAGAIEELRGTCDEVDPFDVSATAAALAAALDRDADERAAQWERRVERATGRDAGAWMADQLAAASPASAR